MQIRRPSRGQSLLPAKISYFKGPQSEWKTGIKTYGSLQYLELWKGIDLVYTGLQNRLEHRFIVKPGADRQRIQMSYRGVEKLSLSPEGSLHIQTPAGSFEEGSLFAYQERDGKKETGRGELCGEEGLGRRRRWFRVGAL
jgi:hypothetical protein